MGFGVWGHGSRVQGHGLQTGLTDLVFGVLGSRDFGMGWT